MYAALPKALSKQYMDKDSLVYFLFPLRHVFTKAQSKNLDLSKQDSYLSQAKVLGKAKVLGGKNLAWETFRIHKSAQAEILHKNLHKIFRNIFHII